MIRMIRINTKSDPPNGGFFVSGDLWLNFSKRVSATYLCPNFSQRCGNGENSAFLLYVSTYFDPDDPDNLVLNYASPGRKIKNFSTARELRKGLYPDHPDQKQGLPLKTRFRPNFCEHWLLTGRPLSEFQQKVLALWSISQILQRRGSASPCQSKGMA